MRYRLEGTDGRLIGYTWLNVPTLGFGEVLRSGSKLYRVLEVITDCQVDSSEDCLHLPRSDVKWIKTLKVVQIYVDEKNLELCKEKSTDGRSDS